MQGVEILLFQTKMFMLIVFFERGLCLCDWQGNEMSRAHVTPLLPKYLGCCFFYLYGGIFTVVIHRCVQNNASCFQKVNV